MVTRIRPLTNTDQGNVPVDKELGAVPVLSYVYDETTDTVSPGIGQGQILDENNSKVITSVDAQPGNAWIGTATRTRSNGIIGEFISAISPGAVVSGTYTFEFGEDGVNFPISIGLHSSDFSTIRYRQLLNVGEYYRARFEPDAPLGAAIVVLQSQLSRQSDPLFVVPANHEFEEEEAAFAPHFAFLKAFDGHGKSKNLRATGDSALVVHQARQIITPAGSAYAEGLLDYIRHDFGEDNGEVQVASLVDVGSGGTATYSPGNGVLFSSEFGICHFHSSHQLLYGDNPGHGIVGEQTFFLDPDSDLVVGDAVIRFGYGTPTNGFGYEYTAAGFATWLTKDGIDIFHDLQSDGWNLDPADGSEFSDFIRLVDGERVPEAVNFNFDNLYHIEGEFLYAAGQLFGIKTPLDEILFLHTHQYPNSQAKTSLRSAVLSQFIYIDPGTTGANLLVRSGSWHGGVFSSKAQAIARDPNDVLIDTRHQGRHYVNSTYIPLNGNTGGTDHIFLGMWFEWQSYYVGMPVEIISNVSGTLHIDLSEKTTPLDGVDTDIDDSISIVYSPVDGLARRTFTLQSRWVRIRYINGLDAQERFSLDTSFVTASTAMPLSPLSLIPENRSMGGMNQALLLATKNEDTTLLTHLEATVGVSEERGLNNHITGQTAPLDIASLETLVTGAAIISDANWTQLPSTPLAERATVCYSNLDTELRVRLSENNTKAAEQGGVVFPLSSKEFDLGPGQVVFFRLENQGIATNTQNLNGAGIANNVGVANPTNLLTSNNTFATFDANTDSLDITGFSITPVLETIQSVKLKLEAKIPSSPISEQAAWVDVQTGTAGNVTSVVSSSVTADANHFYVVAISRKNTAAAVSSVVGMGLTWTLLDDIANGVDTRISVYYAVGTGATNGTVTASFSTAATNAVIAVHRFSGVKFSDPFGSHETLTGASTSSYSDTLSVGTDRGLAVVCVNSRERTHTAGGSYTERNETQSTISAGGASTAMEATETAAIVGTGTVAYSGTFSGNANWSLVVFTLNPSTVYPVIRARYMIGVEPYGATELNVTLVATSDTLFEANITGDRSWLFSDIANLTVSINSPTVGAISAQVDRIGVELVETNNGATALVCYEEVGGFPNS